MKLEPLETRLLKLSKDISFVQFGAVSTGYGSEELTLLQIVTTAFNAWIKCVFMLLQRLPTAPWLKFQRSQHIFGIFGRLHIERMEL